MVDLRARPFYLDDEGSKWVSDTMGSLTLKEKVGQLFCEILWNPDEASPDDVFRVIAPGAVMYRPFSGLQMNTISERLQRRAKVPLLIACNLERGGSGGNGGLLDGTYIASPMGVAATGDAIHAHRTGVVAGREGAAAGINWTFGPIVDIDRNPFNPITNVRTYGSDVETIIGMAQGYIAGCWESDLGVTLKHFPGDGIDFRDQHLMTTVNSLNPDEWRATFGKIYQSLIDFGAQAVMSAHIMQPALSRLMNPKLMDCDILPASLAAELNIGVLRDELGFNGLIVTDATQMVGFTSALPRSKAVPTAIANGCDMFLFTINQLEDVKYMLAGLEDGTLSYKRLDDAVTRILAMKASLKLHVKQRHGCLVPAVDGLSVLGCEEHVRWAQECADKAVTLVRDREGILPLSPIKHRQVVLVVVNNDEGSGGLPPEITEFKTLLENEGFVVTYFSEAPRPGRELALHEYATQVDLFIYYANMKVGSSQTTIRLTWQDFLGESSPKYVKDIPAIFISFSNPYHLVDVPMMQAYINAYSSNIATVHAVIEKLLGRSAFVGRSPIDPSAGLWDTAR